MSRRPPSVPIPLLLDSSSRTCFPLTPPPLVGLTGLLMLSVYEGALILRAAGVSDGAASFAVQ